MRPVGAGEAPEQTVGGHSQLADLPDRGGREEGSFGAVGGAYHGKYQGE